jgi:PAS domain S-box-containing protein
MRGRRCEVVLLNQFHMPISIVNEKKSIVRNILLVIVIIGGLLTTITAIRDAEARVSVVNTIINGSAVLVLTLILLAGNRISYEVNTWAIIICFIFIGTKSIHINGLASSSYNFFLFASLIALLIFDSSKSWYVIIISSLIYIVVSALFAFGVFQAAIKSTDGTSDKIKWVREIFSHLFLLFIVIGGVGRLKNSFITSIAELDESNQKLNQYNEELRNQLDYTKEMENKVTETEMNFKKLFDESNDGIIVCDADGNIVEANKSISAMVDFPRTYLIGRNSSEFVINEDKRTINQLSIDKVRSAKIRELHVLGQNGIRIPVEVNYNAILFKEKKCLLVTVRDIRERKQTEQKVLNAVIQAEENERSRFAKDLHDDLGPILSSIKMYIQSLRSHEDAAEKKDLINRLIFTVDDSIKSIRKISYNLSSHLLQNMGLLNAVKTHVERINLAKAVTINLNHNFEKDIRLASNIEIVSYRVLLELINNSLTHSRGDVINIEMLMNQDRFVINYSDNGIGFDIDRILNDNSKGIGLRNIISRVKSIHGHLDFRRQEKGFSLGIAINL